MLTPDFIGQLVGDRELQKVTWDSFMAQDRPRIFDGSANVEIFRFRVVGRDEIKTAVVLVINSRGIHEAPGTGWFEGLRKLPNRERPNMRRHRYQPVVLEEANHLGLTTLISLQESILICGNVFTT